MWREDTFPLLLKYFFLKLIGKSKLDFRDAFVPWSDKTKRFYHFFTKKELQSLIKNVGFSIVKEDIAKNEIGRRFNLYLIARK